MVICLYYVLKFISQIPYHNQSFIKYRKLQTLTKQNYYLDNSSDVCIKTVESDPSQITKSNSIQIDGSNHHEICWNFLKLSQAQEENELNLYGNTLQNLSISKGP